MSSDSRLKKGEIWHVELGVFGSSVAIKPMQNYTGRLAHYQHSSLQKSEFIFMGR
ncbi:MAG: hypothetical protein KME29_12490 [Calothrix sp. FI2-JRJ7]|nr:hypothetical protein [Calothrix sp. FI2-JRJ7]